MGDAGIKFLLDNMSDLMRYHVNLISGAESEFQRLHDELTMMRILLEDASKKRYKEEHSFKVWERNLRSAVVEIEDAIDTFITEAAISKKASRMKRLFGTKPDTLANRIKSLRKGKLQEALDTSALVKLKLAFTDESDINIKKRQQPPRQDNVVGFEDETEKLIGYLLEPSNGLDVVTIVGMPGLGKTTVAWQIYQDPRIKYEFPTLIWVVVSQEFNKREVLLTILNKFRYTDSISDHLSLDDLENMVKEYLQRSKFLLFLDDVWTVEVWKEISCFLPKDNENGRVLITTRHEGVSRYANPKRDPHKLRFLTEEESWLLLRLELFGSYENFPPPLEKYGKIIAENCYGLPLAIILIAGILFDKVSLGGGIGRIKQQEWKLISANTGTYIRTMDTNHHMKNVISLSYEKLPSDLRYCFLYLATFPENSKISVCELTKLWIAEGFIIQLPSGDGKTLEATAHDYLEELINLNLVMVDKVNPHGKAKTCCIHDTIRQFCKNEAAFEQQNLFQEVTKGDDGIFLFNENQKCRRLVLHSFVNDFFLKKFKFPKTRSFLSYTEPINLELKEIPAFMDGFELLRVFNAKTINFLKFPIKLTELVHLRYLTLTGKDLKSLPSSITKLWNLQTLMVDTQSSTLEIKANIWIMMQLRHVITKAPIVLTCKEMKGDGGDKLQTLDKLSPESCTEEVFKKAKNLITLGIRGDISKLADSMYLEQLHLLETLKLVNYANHSVVSKNPLPCLPGAFPRNLMFLTISNTQLEWSHMSTVGKIPRLQVLKLKDNAFVGDCWDSVLGGFLSLEYLYITHSEDLTLWRIRDNGDPFPILKTVVVKNCEKLENVPKDLMRKLDKLELHCVTANAVKSAKEVEEEMKQESGTKRGQFKLIVSHGDM